MIHKAIVLLLVGAGLVALQAQEEDNLLKNPSAEITVAQKDFPIKIDVTGSAELPLGWGVYGGGGSYEWGSSSQEGILRTGYKSVFLKLKEPAKAKDGQESANAAIIIGGENNGYSSSNAIPVKPGEYYRFAFWIKGNVPRVSVHKAEWKTIDGKQQRIISPLKTEKDDIVSSRGIVPSDEWTMYSGDFRVSDGATHMVLMIICGTGHGMRAGQVFYIDDAEIVKVTPTR